MAVVREVSQRLADIGRHDAAAEVLRAADQPEEAVSVAVAGGAWEKARESARGHGQLSDKVGTAFLPTIYRSSYSLWINLCVCPRLGCYLAMRVQQYVGTMCEFEVAKP